ncbi:S-adenosyl-L-methionine-dependent methyltransferase [Nemania sp. NC0429]|nr:S-adenosyl-L-methionine-dependent methyltransferase [Nemania sp. NC0429]
MSPNERSKLEARKGKKRPPRQKRSPIETAITSWHEKHVAHLGTHHDVGDLVAQAPKRWTAYGPFVLLPTGSFTSPAWRDVLDSASRVNSEKADKKDGNSDHRGPALLWRAILEQISGPSASKLTHLAVNEGIPLHLRQSTGEIETEAETETRREARDSENILRSPSGLRMLYGDFGPSGLSTSTPTEREDKEEEGGEADFSRAFWVSTKQNGITQTWAPRWTMFSRGNIKEKARLLSFHDDGDEDEDTGGKDDARHTADEWKQKQLSHGAVPAGAVAVDLYAGIGYFAFCYAALGFRVLCWELNAWSVEGLRRGAGANGWAVRVVVPGRRRGRGRETGKGDERGDESVNDQDDDEEEEEAEEKMLRDVLAGDETIIVFLEDNKRAARRIRKLDELTTRERGNDVGDSGRGLRMRDVMHVNCGLLPSSRGSWDAAWEIASRAPRAWIHVHDNVGVADIEARKGEIIRWFAARSGARDDDGDEDEHGGIWTQLCVEHVEMVKTFAPGVWHCVFDLCIRKHGDDGADNTT